MYIWYIYNGWLKELCLMRQLLNKLILLNLISMHRRLDNLLKGELLNYLMQSNEDFFSGSPSGCLAIPYQDIWISSG